MPEQKRIVYLQYTNPGVLPPIQQSAAILASQGWAVRFLGIHLEGDAGRLEVGALPGIQVERLRRRHASGWLLKGHYFVFLLWCWYKILRIRPDVLYISDPITTPAGAFLSLVMSLPIIYHEHDSPFESPRSRTERLLTRTRNFLARRARLCVLPNDLRAEAFSRAVAGPAPVCRVMNCPSVGEIRVYPNRPADRQFRVYYHGSVVPDRVPLALLDMLLLVPDTVVLVVAGYGTSGCPEYFQELAAQVAARALESRVTLLGPVTPRTELLRLCSQHDLGLALLPLETADPNVRASAGASNKIFEYFACGLPALVSDLPDHRGLFVDAGMAKACNPDSAESIARAIRWFLAHPSETSEMGERGRKKVREDWNYEAQFQPVLAFLSSGLARPEMSVRVSKLTA